MKSTSPTPGTGAGPRSAATLCHVHDPMCSWCWAWRPVFTTLRDALPDDIELRHVLGGLAPDSDAPMPAPMRTHLEGVWRHIQRAVPGTRFEFRFWTDNVPKRSTWRACRAVLVAAELSPGGGDAMTQAIQTAYYLEARNPSEREVLIDLATGLGLDGETFAQRLDGAAAHAALDAERALASRLGVQGFPSLRLITADDLVHEIPIDYRDSRPTLEAIAAAIGANAPATVSDSV